MKYLFVLGWLFLSTLTGFAQHNLSLKPVYSPKNNTVDEKYTQEKFFENAKSLADYAQETSTYLSQQGYFAHRSQLEKINDSSYLLKVDLGKQIKYTQISLQNISDDALAIIASEHDNAQQWHTSYAQTEAYLRQWLQVFEANGYPMTSFDLSNQKISNDTVFFDLIVDMNQARKLDAITIQPYEKFPKGFRKQIEKIFLNKVVASHNLSAINEMIEQYNFVRPQKPAEILFTEDQTALFLYIEKASNNRAEGILGFTTDENDKVQFTGNADIELNNVMNWGERFNIYWKNDGNQQSTFKANISLPYIFSSPLGIDAGMEIFRQDSTQQNTKLKLAALYHLNYRNKVGIGYQSTSSVAGDQNLYAAENYTNRFVTANFMHERYRNHFLFPTKTMADFSLGYGTRNTSTMPSTDQYFVALNASHIVDLNQRNSLKFQAEAYYLASDAYLYNELYRFGGVHSIRGFAESSLTAKLMSGIYTEYRYLLTQQIYAHTITDFAYYSDPMANFDGLLYSFGLGVGINTPGGLFNLIYANGIQPESTFKLSNSIVHLSYKTRF